MHTIVRIRFTDGPDVVEAFGVFSTFEAAVKFKDQNPDEFYNCWHQCHVAPLLVSGNSKVTSQNAEGVGRGNQNVSDKAAEGASSPRCG